MLSELCSICNDLGSPLDGTATNGAKYRDRQEAHMLVYKVLYAAICDEPENDQRDIDIEIGVSALFELRELSKKIYKDKNGN